MHAIDFTAEQKTALFKYAEAGAGRIDHVFMRTDETSQNLNAYEKHRQAAKVTMNVIEESCVTALEYDDSKLRGTKVVMADFLGVCYDVAARNFRTDLNFGVKQGKDSFLDGYAMAFLHSAPRVRTVAERNELFTQMLSSIFGGLGNIDEIYSWDTSFCTFFDSAREWWGGFLWTISLRDGTFVGIASGDLD